MKRAGLLVPLLSFSVAGCDDVSGPGVSRILESSVRFSTVPLTALLTLELSSPSPVTVEYQALDGPLLIQRETEFRREHEILLPRLWPSATYSVRVRAGEGPVRELDAFETGPLPAGLEAIDFQASGEASHPLTFLEIPRVGDWGTGYAVIVDGSGRVVWWYPFPFVNGSVPLEGGRFALVQSGGWDVGVRIVDAAGQTVAQLDDDEAAGRWAHHDVVRSGRGTLFVLSTDEQMVGDRSIVGEAVWEWDPDSGVATKRWSAFDHLSIGEWGVWSQDADWLHANSLHVGPRGNVLISLRNLSQVISIAPDFERLEWRLGGIGTPELEASSDFAFASEEDRFVLEHTATLVSEAGDRSRVMVFDNGWGQRPYSRALELELDHAAGTARSMWEFQPEPANYSAIVSLARRLENGNTFVTFGASEGTLESTGDVAVYEVAPDGTPIWHLRLGGAASDPWFLLYRATPLETIAGEAVAP